MEKPKLLGYRNGFAYFLGEDKNIYRGDYSNSPPSLKWYSTLNGFYASITIFGPLYNENGKIVQIFEEGGKIVKNILLNNSEPNFSARE